MNFTVKTHLHHKLMSPGHESQAIGVVKGLRNVLSERVTRSTRTDAPAAAVVRVGPQQVAHGTLVGNFLETVQRANVVEGVDGRR